MNFVKTSLRLFCLFKLYTNFTSAEHHFKIEYEWSQIEFDFPNEEERDQAIKNGTFREGYIQPIDVQVHHDKSKKTERKFFITFVRFPGTPTTVGIITDKLKNGNPIVTYYPNWEWQTNVEECKEHRMVSVYRIFIDDCDRLWLLDTGSIGENQVCAPQILAFDLKTDSLLRRYEIPFDQHLNTSLYVTPVVDVKRHPTNCEDTFVYNADPMGNSLLVYDFRNNKSWRIFDKSFIPDPIYNNWNIDGIKYTDVDGILGLALSPPGHKRKLFYHAMSSGTENWIYTEHLKNESLFSTALGSPQLFHTYNQTRRTQSCVEAMDSKGNLYFGLMGDVKIAAWNINYSYSECNFRIIGCNKKTMQYPSGMKVIANENGEEILYFFATSLQKTLTGSLFPNQTNFRIFSGKIKDLLKIERCR